MTGKIKICSQNKNEGLTRKSGTVQIIDTDALHARENFLVSKPFRNVNLETEMRDCQDFNWEL